jgi:pyridoxamine 5'-phosphate oxidase
MTDKNKPQGDTFAALRKEYVQHTLEEADMLDNPFDQFNRWFDDAVAAGVPHANAMTLASADSRGRPSIRLVLLKGCDHTGFVFFTNYDSRKGEELAQNPHACLHFSWMGMERQVRIEGRVVKTSAAESDAYFASRPLGASPQSQVIPNREALEQRVAFVAREQGEHAKRPEYWGGYRVIPERMEFWQGRESRLHDRLQYRLLPHQGWIMERLAP